MAVGSVAAGRSGTELSGENRENKTFENLGVPFSSQPQTENIAAERVLGVSYGRPKDRTSKKAKQ
jgi:hypothetical protein